VAEVVVEPWAAERLAVFFHRNGYVRALDPERRKKNGRSYRKGAEVRLVAWSRAELKEIRQLLKRAGFKVVRPFAKDNQWRQPVYGVAEVARFLTLVGERKRDEPGATPK
jgi:hypothetical protein